MPRSSERKVFQQQKNNSDNIAGGKKRGEGRGTGKEEEEKEGIKG